MRVRELLDVPDLGLRLLTDVAGMERQLKAGADANAKGDRDTTPLMYAAAYGSLATMRALVGAGADVNAKNAFNATALLWCASTCPLVISGNSGTCRAGVHGICRPGGLPNSTASSGDRSRLSLSATVPQRSSLNSLAVRQNLTAARWR